MAPCIQLASSDDTQATESTHDESIATGNHLREKASNHQSEDYMDQVEHNRHDMICHWLPARDGGLERQCGIERAIKETQRHNGATAGLGRLAQETHDQDQGKSEYDAT